MGMMLMLTVSEAVTVISATSSFNGKHGGTNETKHMLTLKMLKSSRVTKF